MTKGFSSKEFSRLLGLLLALVIWALPGLTAGADKAVEPLTFGADSGAIAVLSFYETDPATQADAVKSFYKITKSFYKTIPGFHGLAFLASADGTRVVELSQWDNQESYDAFQTSLSSGDDKDYAKYYEKYSGEKYSGGKGKSSGKGKEEVSLGDPYLTASFEVDQVLSPPGMVAAIPGSMALVQISDLATDTSELQAEALLAARQSLAGVSALYPAPRTTVLLKGLATPHVALLANWGSVAEFSNPDELPLLTLAVPADEVSPEVEANDGEVEASEAGAAAIAADSHLYQTIKVITPKTEKYGKG